MLYNQKTDYPFWLRDYATQVKILKAGMASMDFICELYRPALHLVDELLAYLDSNRTNLDTDTEWTILKTIRELQNEVTFYQNILKESFSVYDSNS